MIIFTLNFPRKSLSHATFLSTYRGYLIGSGGYRSGSGNAMPQMIIILYNLVFPSDNLYFNHGRGVAGTQEVPNVYHNKEVHGTPQNIPKEDFVRYMASVLYPMASAQAAAAH